MSSAPSKLVDLPAPYTGTLRYPLEALITLARTIIKAQEDHHVALRAAAEAAEDEDEELEQSEIIVDISQAAFALDGARWKADAEVVNPGMEWDANSLKHFEDPRGAEKALFKLSIKAQQVNSILFDCAEIILSLLYIP